LRPLCRTRRAAQEARERWEIEIPRDREAAHAQDVFSNFGLSGGPNLGEAPRYAVVMTGIAPLVFGAAKRHFAGINLTKSAGQTLLVEGSPPPLFGSSTYSDRRGHGGHFDEGANRTDSTSKGRRVLPAGYVPWS
jgi:hypothetical protein